MPDARPAPGAKELFRYVRLSPPRVVDLHSRLTSYGEVKSLLSKTSSDKKKRAGDRKTWARKFSKSNSYVSGVADLKLTVFDHLSINDVPVGRLPSRACIKNAKEFDCFIKSSSRNLELAKKRTTLSLFASSVLGESDQTTRLSRLLQFLELLPVLSKTGQELNYAPIVLERYTDKAIPDRHPKQDSRTSSAVNVKRKDAGKEVLAAWDISNRYVRWKKSVLAGRIEEVKRQTFEFKPPKTTTKSKKVRERRFKEERRRQFRSYIASKNKALKELQAEHQRLGQTSVHERVAIIESDTVFRSYFKDKYGVAPGNTMSNVAPQTITGGFCDLFKQEKEKETAVSDTAKTCIFQIQSPCVEQVAKDVPAALDPDDVRPLGVAELITVEEKWMRYTPGEISSIENVLKGEVRKKKVKSIKYFEEVAERMTEEVEERDSETQSKVKQDLSSHVESEIASRFQSDINSSLGGSGGGNVGLVSFKGATSLGAGVHLGLDTKFGNSSESNFAQEILSKAVERAKKTTTELRRSRSYQKYETTNYHEINNAGANAEHTNGIYCYLDKTICVTERVYGLRKFFVAEVVSPGRDVVTKETQKLIIDLSNAGEVPAFDLSPADITPGNYLSYVGKYRAANVSPPPPYVKVVSKTYKTDSTNESRNQDEGMVKKVADMLTPFFGTYRRFLIQDKIDIPEGYKVQEVRVTVTHGTNGVSIPAHLPFSLLGASLYALPTMAAAAVPPYTLYYLPMAIWQVLYTASPLMHYNADSSNVTINVGHDAEDSPYFFFQPDVLLRDMIEMLSNSSVITEEFVSFLRAKLEALYAAFTTTSNNAIITSLTSMTDETKNAINQFITDLNSWLGSLVTTIIPSIINGTAGSGPAFPPLPTIDPNVIAEVPKAILAPFQTFFDAVVDHIEELMNDALGDILDYFNTMLVSAGTHLFSNTNGFTDVLPVSFNCVAIKPGVTINLSACLVRIDELALDAWRMETFDRLNQAFYQMQADYDSRMQMKGAQRTYRDSPELMRQEERLVIKRRVIDMLHRKYGNNATDPVSLDELKLFEHAIDWENASFRVYDYGPRGLHVAYQKLGMYDAADERRRQFMNASWAQVLLPLRDDERLEQAMLSFVETGTVDFEANLLSQLGGGNADPLDELTEIYRDLVLQRQQLNVRQETRHEETMPTDLIVIYEPGEDAPYPVNPSGCGDSDDTQ